MDVSILPHLPQEGLSLELALPLSPAHPWGCVAFSDAALVIPAMLPGSVLHTMRSPLAFVVNRCWSVSGEPPPAPPSPSPHSYAALCQIGGN